MYDSCFNEDSTFNIQHDRLYGIIERTIGEYFPCLE